MIWLERGVWGLTVVLLVVGWWVNRGTIRIMQRRIDSLRSQNEGFRGELAREHRLNRPPFGR